ncbi:helicase-related protein [Microbacterium sp. A84]|uniref:helicase-related protein n=1 Tax=Microbacterium sp. A84 TaxID=3450715 RepID=UPI003F6DDBD7
MPVQILGGHNVTLQQQKAASSPLNVAPGSIVTVRDADWLVTNASPTQDGLLVEVTGLSELVRDTRAAFYEGLDDIVPVDPRAAKLRADDSQGYRRARLWLESTLRRTPLPLGEGHLSVSTRMLTDTLGYQRSAVRKALSTENLRPRILLADTVGLGKTIEIGMILSELVRRGRGERILIVTPKHVLEQMQFEMWTRFALPFVRLDSVGIQRVRQKLPATRNPFSLYKRAIISIDTLKQERYLNHLRKHQWDAVVIDESHNLSGTTQNNALARVLAPNTEALILASATPHNGRKESFAELIRLLEPTAVSPAGDVSPEALNRLVIRRHRHSAEVAREVGDDWVEREELQHFLVPASSTEDAVADELADVWLYPKGSSPYSGENKGLFPWTLAKSFLSSPPALLESVRNRIRVLGATRTPAQDTELAALSRLKSLAEESVAGESAKLTKLVEYLKKIGIAKNSGERVVIFSERVPTLLWLEESLREKLKLKDEQVAVLHGGLSDVEQQAVVESFKQSSSPIRVLVTGDIASEGVNLHAQCHELVHFDIPWSLIRIEQRNGRIDRYGQRHAPQITTLLLSPSNDRFSGDVRVLKRLVEREDEAHGALGDAAALMGAYSVAAEEKAIEQALVKGTAIDDVVPGVDGIATDAADPWLALLTGSNAESTTQIDAAPIIEDEVATGLFASDTDYLASALQEAFETPAASLAGGGVAWKDHAGYGLVELSPTDDLKQRLRVLPQTYLAERSVLDDVKLATTETRAQASLKEARDDSSNTKGLWPETHYLGPLHPVLDWAGDRVLAKLGRNEVFVVRGSVPAPTVLLLGTLSNARGQVIATSFVGVTGPMVRPYESAHSALTDLGLTGTLTNPGAVADVESLQSLIPSAVDRATEHLLLTTEAAAAAARRRVDEWSNRVAEWVDSAGDLAQRADLKGRSNAVREEERTARTMLPAQTLARPVLVIVPEEA